MDDRKYTADEVHQIVDMVLRSMDFHPAPVGNREQTNLDNDIAHVASSSDAKVSLTVSEAARMTGICRPKIYELVRSGQFHTVKIGKKILISRKSILEWIQGGIEDGRQSDYRGKSQ